MRTRSGAQVRLAPAVRRQQLVDVAARLLSKQGTTGLEVQAVATVACVTRPVVYRFFPTRLALIQAVLDEFEFDLSHRFHLAIARTLGKSIPEIVEAFVLACCEAIDAKGRGAWQLMYARGADVEAASLGRATLGRMLQPWLPRISELTGLPRQRVTLLAEIVVAAGGAALDGWLQGTVSQRESVRVATRTIGTLLAEFSPAGR
jgi:AcrR family transcriptional regulator